MLVSRGRSAAAFQAGVQRLLGLGAARILGGGLQPHRRSPADPAGEHLDLPPPGIVVVDPTADEMIASALLPALPTLPTLPTLPSDPGKQSGCSTT